MPFPVIDRNRYWAYAGGISSLLVLIIWLSFFIPTTTTLSQPIFVTALSETFSHSWLHTFLLMLTLHIANKFSKLTFLMSIVISELRSLWSRMNIFSIIQVQKMLVLDVRRSVWWSQDFKETLAKVYRQANDHSSSDYKDSELILQDFINRYVDQSV